MASISELARPYLAVYRARFLLILQYRAAAVAGMTTQLWWGAMKLMVLAAFYAQAPDQPLTFAQAASYIWLVQAFLTVLPWNVDPDIEHMMKTGSVAYERLRPLDTYWFWFAGAVAKRSAPPMLRAAPIFVLAGGVLPLVGLDAWRLAPPAGAVAAAMFAVSLIMAVLLAASLATLTNIRVVAMISGRGMQGLVWGLTIVFSGMVLPLQLFPEWMQTALFFQPFAGLMDIPFRIYFGQLTGGWAAVGLGCQVFWTVAFIGIGWAWMERTMARLEVLGG